jgi:hypothetical protein
LDNIEGIELTRTVRIFGGFKICPGDIGGASILTLVVIKQSVLVLISVIFPL